MIDANELEFSSGQVRHVDSGAGGPKMFGDPDNYYSYIRAIQIDRGGHVTYCKNDLLD